MLMAKMTQLVNCIWAGRNCKLTLRTNGDAVALSFLGCRVSCVWICPRGDPGSKSMSYLL